MEGLPANDAKIPEENLTPQDVSMREYYRQKFGKVANKALESLGREDIVVLLNNLSKEDADKFVAALPYDPRTLASDNLHLWRSV